MRFSPLSFLMGLAAASLVPLLSRVMRPLAVEATAAGLGMVDDARRLVAERMEGLEDIVAEARARREEQLSAESNGHHLEAEQQEVAAVEETERVGARRRSNGGRRRGS